MWNDEGLKYPEVIFDTIKDNTSMPDLLSSQSRLHTLPMLEGDSRSDLDSRDTNVTATLWKLEWLQDLLESLWNNKAFPTVLPKVFLYLGEELQHVTYPKIVREQALITLFKVCCTTTFLKTK